MPISTKCTLICPKCNTSRISILGDVRNPCDYLCKRCNTFMKIEKSEISNFITVKDRMYNFFNKYWNY